MKRLLDNLFDLFLFYFVQLGFVVDYISHPVINSFTTAAAITIACSQLKVSDYVIGEMRHLASSTVERFIVVQASNHCLHRIY